MSILERMRQRIAAKDRRRWLGLVGERLAAVWLRLHGFRVLQHDFETPFAQVDLLLSERQPWGWSLVICEVKTRRGSFHESSLKKEQIERLWRAARWLQGQCDRRHSDRKWRDRVRGRQRRRRRHLQEIAVRVDLVEVEIRCICRCLPWVRVRHTRAALWQEESGRQGNWTDGLRW